MNQDACMAFCPDDGSCFAIVCDGMGGGNAGDVAAQLTVEMVTARVRSTWRRNMTAQSAEYLLLTALTAANVCVYDASHATPELSGMGTTSVACILVQDMLVVAHAGDSRAYSFNGGLRQLTRDHSWVQDQVDIGAITQEQAFSHPRKNLITRALGVEERIKLDISSFPMTGKETIILCSDGLTNYVEEARIAEIMKTVPFDGSPRRLIDEANANGGGDNITVALIAQDS